MVDVTLYFRQGRGDDAYLVPVVREVPVGADLASTAVDLLLKGPVRTDSADLQPALPTTTRVRDFSVDDTIATVDLSAHVVSDAAQVGKRPEHELLALAAIANTLTEFPEVSRVAVTVEGEAGGPFWGGWGLPRTLFRDDSVIGPDARVAELPPLGTFSRRAQEAGERRRARAVVSNVRIRPRATYLRVTLELTDREGRDLVGSAPRTRAVRKGDDILISVGARAASGLAGDQPVADPAFAGARVDVRESPAAVRVTIRPNNPAAFALRTLTDPARVVLDIRR